MTKEATQSQVARRLQPFGETIFAEISRLALEHKAVNLGQGFPNFEGPTFVKDAAVEAIYNQHNQYARSIGQPDLNLAIARSFQKRSGYAPDPLTEITVTSGCTEAIAASLIGLVNPGDEVIIFEPYYDSYRACIAMAGATPRFVPLCAPDFSFDPADLAAAFNENTRAILVNTPHNPTGKVFTVSELQQIAALCKQHDVIAITDEVYEHLVYDGEHTFLSTVDGMYERTLTLSSIGKTFSLTGWKIGWAIGPPSLTEAVRAAHQFLTFATATPLQAAAAAALNTDETYFHSLRQTFARRRDYLAQGLEAAGFTVHLPAGGYFIMADHTRFGFENDVAFCRHMIEHVGVAAIPPSAFYDKAGGGRDLVRFAFCKDDQVLEEAINRLKNGFDGR